MQLSSFRHINKNGVGRGVVQCSIAIPFLALITVASVRFHLNLATASLLSVVVIVILARVGDFVSSVLASIVAGLLLMYIAPPVNSFRVNDSFDVVAIIAFLITALTIVRLVSRLRTISEQLIASVNRKLIDAEERVRERIGKDLHEDIEQRLALLANYVAEIGTNGVAAAENGPNSPDRIKEQVSEILADVQALAYELCPYKLRYLGLAAAMKSFCEKFAQQHNVAIDFRSQNLPGNLPLDIALSLTRVLQEALCNSAKHSGSQRFEVELFQASEAIHLNVHDSGLGFDPKFALQGPGLGLISMRERMKLVRGELLIGSQPNRGTTIFACAPFWNGHRLGAHSKDLARKLPHVLDVQLRTVADLAVVKKFRR